MPISKDNKISKNPHLQTLLKKHGEIRAFVPVGVVVRLDVSSADQEQVKVKGSEEAKARYKVDSVCGKYKVTFFEYQAVDSSRRTSSMESFLWAINQGSDDLFVAVRRDEGVDGKIFYALEFDTSASAKLQEHGKVSRRTSSVSVATAVEDNDDMPF